MLSIKHRGLVPRQGHVLTLSQFGSPQLQCSVEEVIHHHPAGQVIVVRELHVLRMHVLGDSVHRIQPLQLRQTFGLDIHRPVISPCHRNRTRSCHRGEFDVAGANPQI